MFVKTRLLQTHIPVCRVIPGLCRLAKILNTKTCENHIENAFYILFQDEEHNIPNLLGQRFNSECSSSAPMLSNEIDMNCLQKQIELRTGQNWNLAQLGDKNINRKFTMFSYHQT